MKKIKRVKLFVKDLDHIKELRNILKESLLKYDFIIDDEFDLSISLGGDGTFLKMIHANNFDNKGYYIGINAGSLGFLTSYDAKDINLFIESLIKENYKINELPILKTIIETNNEILEYLSINELTIRKNNFSTMKSDVYINDELLNTYTGDGLIISTSLGTTGYNLSFNGPIVDKDINTLTITPIAPITNKVYKSINNSIVISGNKKITIMPNGNKNICVLNDGKLHNIENIKRIEIELSNNKIECLVPIDYSNINVIKSKTLDTKDYSK